MNRLQIQPGESASASRLHPLEKTTVPEPVSVWDEPRIERFVLTVRHEAHRCLDPEQAEALAGEVHAHLIEAMEDRLTDGLTLSAAAKAVLAGFGNARTLVRRVADSAMESQHAQVARQVGFYAVVALQCLALVVILDRQFLMPTGTFGPTVYRLNEERLHILFAISLLPVMIGSFLGRKFEVKRYLATATAFFVAILLVIAGNEMTVVDRRGVEHSNIQRNSLSEGHAFNTLFLEEAREDLALLHQGRVAFSTVDQPLPAIFAPRGRYVLLPDPSQNFSPFDFKRQPDKGGRIWPRRTSELSVTTTNTTTDRAKAVRTWQRNGVSWQVCLEHFIQHKSKQDQVYRQAEQQAFYFNLRAVIQAFTEYYAFNALWIYLTLLVVLHLLAAGMGRWACRVWRRWLWRLQTGN